MNQGLVNGGNNITGFRVKGLRGGWSDAAILIEAGSSILSATRRACSAFAEQMLACDFHPTPAEHATCPRPRFAK
jgi:hypothetical protein